MKCIVNLPDEVPARIDQNAKRRKQSRSALITADLFNALNSRDDEEVTERLNAVYRAIDSKLDPVLERMQYFTLLTNTENPW